MDDLQFYVLLTVFQSYQDDGWVKKKGCAQKKKKKKNVDYGKDSPLLKCRTTRLPGQHLIYYLLGHLILKVSKPLFIITFIITVFLRL